MADADPSDLVTLADAARMSGRSVATLRRWLRDGSLTRYEGDTPDRGGSAPALVSSSELRGHLASGVAPVASPGRPPAAAAVVSSDAVRIAELEGRAAVVEAQLVAERRRVADLERERDRLALDLADARTTRDDWQARHDAVRSELDAERQRSRTAWWRNLLPGGADRG